MLKLVEIQSHASSYLVHHGFAATWSENNQIAMMTEKGVQILELRFNPHNKTSAIDCYRSSLETSQKAPTDNLGIDATNIFHKSGLQEASALILNPDWAPSLDKTCPITKVVVQTVWSPRGVLHYGRCLLACLTNMGQLTLYGADRCQWVQKFDISRMWLRYFRNKWSKPNKATNMKHQITELQYRASRIKYTAVAWERFQGDEYSCSTLLITASQDGIIGLWIVEDENFKSDLNLEPITMSFSNGIRVKLMKVFDSKLANVTSFLWCSIDGRSGVLIAGNVKGAINSVCINFCDTSESNAQQEKVSVEEMRCNTNMASADSKSHQNMEILFPRINDVVLGMQETDSLAKSGGLVSDHQPNLTRMEPNLEDATKMETDPAKSGNVDLGMEKNRLEADSGGSETKSNFDSGVQCEQSLGMQQQNLASKTQSNESCELGSITRQTSDQQPLEAQVDQTSGIQLNPSAPNPNLLTCVAQPYLIPELQTNLTSAPNPNPTCAPNPNLTPVPQPNPTTEPLPNLTSQSQPNLTSKSNPPGNVEISVETLWPEEDLLSVSSLICWDADNNNVCAVCIKGTHIIVLILRKDNGKLVSKHCHNTKRRNLTGLIKLNNAAFLIGSQQGAIFKLTLVQDDNGEVTFLNETVQTNFIKNRYGVMGLAASRNRAFIAVNVSLNGPYDHSKLKTLSSFVITSFENTEIDPMSVVNSKHFVNLDRIWDCLENARLNILQKSIIYIVPPTIRDQLDTMDINPLIITMWLTNFVAYSLQLEQMESGIESATDNKSQTMTRLYEEIRLLVFTSQTLQRCTLFLSSSSSSSSSFPASSSFALLSLRLMRQWISTSLLANLLADCHSTTRLTAASIVEQIDAYCSKQDGDSSAPGEVCVLCGNDVPELTDFSLSTCTAGHQLPRCSLSLVQIPSDCVHLVCPRCGVLAHPEAVSGNFATCVFCDDQLVADNKQMTMAEICALKEDMKGNRRRGFKGKWWTKESKGNDDDADYEDEELIAKRKRKKWKKKSK